MPGTGLFDFGGPQYDVDDVKIAKNNGDGTLGPLIDVPSVDLFTMNFRVKSAEGHGDARITAVVSQIEAAEITMRGLSIDLDVVELFMGGTQGDSGIAPNRSAKMDVSNFNLPYFALFARSLAGESAGGTMFFVPYIKITSNFEWHLEYNTLVAPQLQGLALGDPVLVDATNRPLLLTIKKYELLPAISYPLPQVPPS